MLNSGSVMGPGGLSQNEETKRDRERDPPDPIGVSNTHIRNRIYETVYLGNRVRIEHASSMNLRAARGIQEWYMSFETSRGFLST
jgi:hypothetical protein